MRCRSGRTGNSVEFIRSDPKGKGEERIDTLLLERLDSGQPNPMTAEYQEKKQQRPQLVVISPRTVATGLIGVAVLPRGGV